MWESLAAARIVDQALQSRIARLLPFGTYDIPCSQTAIIWRLCLEEFPCCRVFPELFHHRRLERRCLALERVHASARVGSLLICLDARKLHATLPAQPRDVRNVDVAPDAVCLAGRETGCEADVIELLSYSIDPSITKRFIECLGVCDPALSGIFPVETNPELVRARVIFVEPSPEVFGRLEKSERAFVDFH